MKIYKGSRQPGAVGGLTVTVDGKPLKHILEHSPDGFQWGYGGSGPADLALSILADCIGLEEARKYYQNFKWDFIANFEDEWEMSDEQIKDWLAKKTTYFERHGRNIGYGYLQGVKNIVWVKR